MLKLETVVLPIIRVCDCSESCWSGFPVRWFHMWGMGRRGQKWSYECWSLIMYKSYFLLKKKKKFHIADLNTT